jgi:hypothetical protein
VRAVVVTGPSDPLAADLAELVRRQWAYDAAIRLLRRPRPLKAEWSVTDDAAAPASEPRGDVLDVAPAFRRVPTGRLVVIGASGSGKTVLAVLLTLDLLAARRPEDPVPVLLPVSSWDPREHLDSWIARRLAEAYPTLTDRRRYGDDALLRLVAAGRVLPILDGLDEMSPRWRSTAITALNTVAAGRPVVLTCRRDAYAAGTPLDGALVIQLTPITAEAAAAYLPAGQVDGVCRWARVVAELREHPGGPLAQALSTPLMVYLARTVYTAPDSDPAQLADPARFPDQARIRAHLLDRYLPAVYAAPDPVPARRSRHYGAEQAQTWLAFLAVRLSDPVTADLAWWNLPRCVSRWRLVAGITTGSVAGLSAGLAAALSATPVFGPGWGLLSGLAAGTYLALLCGLGYGFGRLATPTRRPHQVRLRLRTLLTPSRASVVRGAQCGMIVGLQVGTFLGGAIWIRQGLDAGINQGLTVAILVGLPAGVVEYIAQNLTRPAQEPDAVSPRSSLAGDRTSSLLHAGVGAIVFGLPSGLVVGLLTNPWHGLVTGLGVGAASTLTGVISTGFPVERMPGSGLGWVTFTIARLWLAARRQIPFRLLEFLEDAHARGVLRQAGAVYQFRHVQVREHLTREPCAVNRIEEQLGAG